MRTTLRNRTRNWKWWVASLLPVPSLLFIWELISCLGFVDSLLFPAPHSVAVAIREMAMNGELLRDIVATSGRVAVGYMFGCAVGIVAGLITGRVRLAERMLGQLFHVFRSFPPVALVPFAITWFGLSEAAKYVLVFWGVFFPVWVSTHIGVACVDNLYIRAARTLGARRWHQLTEIIIPAAMPHIVSGMRTAIGTCFMCVFVAEMAGAYEGVGFRISTSYYVFRVDKMLASLFVLGIMGATSDFVFNSVSFRIFPWMKMVNHT